MDSDTSSQPIQSMAPELQTSAAQTIKHHKLWGFLFPKLVNILIFVFFLLILFLIYIFTSPIRLYIEPQEQLNEFFSFNIAMILISPFLLITLISLGIWTYLAYYKYLVIETRDKINLPKAFWESRKEIKAIFPLIILGYLIFLFLYLNMPYVNNIIAEALSNQEIANLNNFQITLLVILSYSIGNPLFRIFYYPVLIFGLFLFNLKHLPKLVFPTINHQSINKNLRICLIILVITGILFCIGFIAQNNYLNQAVNNWPPPAQ